MKTETTAQTGLDNAVLIERTTSGYCTVARRSTVINDGLPAASALIAQTVEREVGAAADLRGPAPGPI
jgi:hypothetical protein